MNILTNHPKTVFEQVKSALRLVTRLIDVGRMSTASATSSVETTLPFRVCLIACVLVASPVWCSAGEPTKGREFLFDGHEFHTRVIERWEVAFVEAQLPDYDRVGNRIRVPSVQKELFIKAITDANALPKEEEKIPPPACRIDCWLRHIINQSLINQCLRMTH